ncbi:MAG: SUF system Fe-S cluster assembly protein [Sandaracinobacteroides sp.]
MSAQENSRRFEVEIVDEVAKPPKQPPLAGDVPPALLGRKRDYLDGFLAEKASEGAQFEGESLQEAVVAALRDIFDPEIPVNIYDLGLIYGVDIDEGHVTVTMTLTTPHCPVAESMPGEVEMRVMAVPGVATAEVNLVWDPAWNPASMSDEARLELGML